MEQWGSFHFRPLIDTVMWHDDVNFKADKYVLGQETSPQWRGMYSLHICPSVIFFLYTVMFQEEDVTQAEEDTKIQVCL